MLNKLSENPKYENIHKRINLYISLLISMIFLVIMILLASSFFSKTFLFFSLLLCSLIMAFSVWRGIANANKIEIRPNKAIQLIFKRMIDILISGMALLLFAPLMLIVAVLVKIGSRGPAFFKQRRLGWAGKEFDLYRFRTMRLDSSLPMVEEFCLRKDPRVTAIGRILRKFSLDELPQFINVFKGDMSLIGPRPRLPYEARFVDKRIFSVLPGITCLWQVSGRYDISFDDWMKLDISYVTNWSIFLDIKILLKTIPVVLFGIGAD